MTLSGVYLGCATGGSGSDLGNPSDLGGASGTAGSNNGGTGGSSGASSGGGGTGGTTGGCSVPTDCDDGNPCTTDTCSGGACHHENNVLICTDDGDPCTNDFCNGGICTHPATGQCDCHAGADCDDNNPCTDDACVNNKCTYTDNTKPCMDDGNGCRDDVCSNGSCTHPNKPMNTPCAAADDDNDPCTDDLCNGAVCVHPDNGTCQCMDNTDCNDSNPCTDDACDTTTHMCMYTNNTGNCPDEGNPCTTEACMDGTCVHTPKDCDDNNPCTTDACTAGSCTHQNNTMPCTDDGDACTDDKCSAGSCAHTPSTMCDDGDICTTDMCTAGVCSNVAIDPCGTPILLETNRKNGTQRYYVVVAAGTLILNWTGTDPATAEVFDEISVGTNQYKLRSHTTGMFVGLGANDDLFANVTQANAAVITITACAATNTAGANCAPNCMGMQIASDTNGGNFVASDDANPPGNELRSRSNNCGTTNTAWESWQIVTPP